MSNDQIVARLNKTFSLHYNNVDSVGYLQMAGRYVVSFSSNYEPALAAVRKQIDSYARPLNVKLVVAIAERVGGEGAGAEVDTSAVKGLGLTVERSNVVWAMVKEEAEKQEAAAKAAFESRRDNAYSFASSGVRFVAKTAVASVVSYLIKSSVLPTN